MWVSGPHSQPDWQSHGWGLPPAPLGSSEGWTLKREEWEEAPTLFARASRSPSHSTSFSAMSWQVPRPVPRTHPTRCVVIRRGRRVSLCSASPGLLCKCWFLSLLPRTTRPLAVPHICASACFACLLILFFRLHKTEVLPSLNESQVSTKCQRNVKKRLPVVLTLRSPQSRRNWGPP